MKNGIWRTYVPRKKKVLEPFPGLTGLLHLTVYVHYRRLVNFITCRKVIRSLKYPTQVLNCRKRPADPPIVSPPNFIYIPRLASPKLAAQHQFLQA